MPARQKLNAAALNAVMLVAGIVGLTFASWRAFLVVGLILIASAVAAGDIRLTPRR